MEDKRLIVSNLESTLKATREFKDMIYMTYFAPGDIKDQPYTEAVVAAFSERTSAWIEVTADSGIALIRDVLRGLGAL